MSSSTDIDAAVDPTLPMAPPTFEFPRRVGRYEVCEPIGRGAMGLVLRAVDPELGREVAIKLLTPSPRLDPSAGTPRLLREAQALAKLSHPNVIHVYDVGMVDGRVFIAMEYVRGGTLRAWLRERPTRHEIIAAFVQAGRGLAAAHAAGLVHRDFKPANVLRGADGRVRVADFGLAAPVRGDEVPTFQSEGAYLLDIRMTATGCAVGTPAYMSPEAHDGAPVDAQSDQWSFCVALYEALYGERPFPSEDPRELAQQVRARPPQPPSEADVPARLRALVLRGLAVEPRDRWPSMTALLEQLEPRRRPTGLWLAAAAMAIGAAALAPWLATRSNPREACDRAAAAVTEVWSEPTRAAVEQAFTGSGVSYAGQTWRKVGERLDAHAQALAEARRGACESRLAEGESAERLDRQVACLARRLSALRGLVAELEQADASTVRNAVQAVGDLRPPGECEGEALGSAIAAVPPSMAAEVEQIYDDMARVRTMTRAIHHDHARLLAADVLAHATRLGHAPLVAEARYLQGTVRMASGEYEAAEHELVEARLEAQAVGDDPLVAKISAELVFLFGRHLRRPDEAERWVRHARAATARLPDPTHAETALEGTLGGLAQANGEFAAALAHYEVALAKTEERLGSLHPETLTLRNNIALSHHDLGDNVRARALLERVLSDRITVYGADHPEVSSTYGNLGVVEQTLGELPAAAAHTQQALDGLEGSVGPQHPLYSQLLTNLANTYYLMGRFDDALRVHERAKILLEQSLGARAFLVGRSLVNLGVLHHHMQHYDEARRAYQQAREILEEHLRPDHPELSILINNLAEVDRDTGHLDAAIAGYDRALALLEDARGPADPELAFSLAGRGQTHLMAQRPDRALADLRRAVALLEGAELDPGSLVQMRKLLATALWDTGEPIEGRRAMEQARREADGLGAGGRDLVEEIDRWLAEHEAP